MADKRTTVDAMKALEALKATYLEQASEVERDLEEMHRLGLLAEKYGFVVVSADDAAKAEKTAKPSKAPPKPRVNGTGPTSVTIRKTAEDYFRRTGTRAMSSAIAKVLAAKGVNVTAKRVSSYLTRSDLFDNQPDHGGYGLAEWKGARAAPNAKEK
jgi:hypothetical protein